MWCIKTKPLMSKLRYFTKANETSTRYLAISMNKLHENMRNTVFQLVNINNALPSSITLIYCSRATNDLSNYYLIKKK